MDLKLADRIRMDWGKFLEISNGSLVMVFMGKIPQSLLPYPKEKIIEALDIISKYFTENNNEEAVKVIESAKPYLDMYVDDREALRFAKSNLSNEQYLDIILSKLSQGQKDLFSQIEQIVNKK